MNEDNPMIGNITNTLPLSGDGDNDTNSRSYEKRLKDIINTLTDWIRGRIKTTQSPETQLKYELRNIIKDKRKNHNTQDWSDTLQEIREYTKEENRNNLEQRLDFYINLIDDIHKEK